VSFRGRLVRIGGIGGVLTYLFHLSRQAGLARGQVEPPGLLVAVGVLSVLFFIRALLSETTLGTDADRQKDFLWGLTVGGVATILIRLVS
jgi:hypothetical protein